MTKTYLVAILLLVTTRWSLWAQINESDTSHVQVRFRSGGSFQRGNVELMRIISQFDLSTQILKNFVFKTQNNHFYQRIFNNKADEDFSSRNYLYFLPHCKMYPYAISFISTNFRRNIDFRTFMGLGATYQWILKKGQNIKLSGNILHEQSTYRDAVFNYQEFDGSDQIKALWSTLYLSGFHQLDDAAIRMTYELYWQQSLEDKVNYRIHLIAAINFKLAKGFSAQSRVNYSFENVTNTSVMQDDLLWTWGITYQFKSH